MDTWMENNLEIDELSSGIMTSCRIFQNIYTISTATTNSPVQTQSCGLVLIPRLHYYQSMAQITMTIQRVQEHPI